MDLDWSVDLFVCCMIWGEFVIFFEFWDFLLLFRKSGNNNIFVCGFDYEIR